MSKGKKALTEKEVRTILSLGGKVRTADIALRFQVSKSLIRDVLSGRSYTEVERKVGQPPTDYLVDP